MKPALTILILVAASSWLLAVQRGSQPLFRTGADLVSVEVSVKRGNNPVRGLTTADFELRDSNVKQTILAIDANTVPLDVTLIADVSAGQIRYLERFQEDLRAIVSLLHPDDRLRVLTLGNDISRVFDFQGATEASVDRKLATGNFSAVHEALVAALLHAPTSSRRHLIVAFTNALDNISSLPATTVEAVAKRADAVLHLIIPFRQLEGWVEALEGVCEPNCGAQTQTNGAPIAPHPKLFRGEANPKFRRTLVAAAESTGGGSHTTSARTDRATMLPAVKQILDDYRSGYLLQYQPVGVQREGWHDLKVKMTRRGSFTVRARNGYFLDTPSASRPGTVDQAATVGLIAERDATVTARVVATVSAVIAPPAAGQLNDQTEVLSRVGSYLESHGSRIPALVCDERFQLRASIGDDVTVRTVKSAIGITRVDTPPAWFAVREVQEFNGRKQPVRADRFAGVLADPPAARATRLQSMIDQTAEYVPTLADRRLSNPLFSFQVLERQHQPRFTFSLKGEEKIAGQAVRKIDFVERSPALIQDESGRDVLSSGSVWIAANGAIARSRVEFNAPVDRPVRGMKVVTTVNFAPDAKLGVWVPASLLERQEQRFLDSASNIDTEATATFQNCRLVGK